MLTDLDLSDFLIESNCIENADDVQLPDERQLWAARTFLRLHTITFYALTALVSRLEPGARLRELPGLDVRVGNHVPPPGGPEIRTRLVDLLEKVAGAHWDPSASPW